MLLRKAVLSSLLLLVWQANQTLRLLRLGKVSKSKNIGNNRRMLKKVKETLTLTAQKTISLKHVLTQISTIPRKVSSPDLPSYQSTATQTTQTADT